MPNVPALASLGVTLAVAVVLGLMVVETLALMRHQPPITTYTRQALLRWPGRVFAAVVTVDFVVGLLTAHFVWDAACG